MLTSNVNPYVLKHLINSDVNITQSTFKEELLSKIQDSNTTKTDAFTYENIKGMTIEEIDEIFLDEDKNQIAKNLRLTTLFTTDDILGQAMFNTVLGQPFTLGYSYMFDRYEDKHSFLSGEDSLTNLLHESIINKKDYGDKASNEVISSYKVNEILAAVKSISFIDSLSNTTKEQRDKQSDYSFLYNDYHLLYEELRYQYNDIKLENEVYLNSFFKS